MNPTLAFCLQNSTPWGSAELPQAGEQLDSLKEATAVLTSHQPFAQLFDCICGGIKTNNAYYRRK